MYRDRDQERRDGTSENVIETISLITGYCNNSPLVSIRGHFAEMIDAEEARAANSLFALAIDLVRSH